MSRKRGSFFNPDFKGRYDDEYYTGRRNIVIIQERQSNRLVGEPRQDPEDGVNPGPAADDSEAYDRRRWDLKAPVAPVQDPVSQQSRSASMCVITDIAPQNNLLRGVGCSTWPTATLPASAQADLDAGLRHNRWTNGSTSIEGWNWNDRNHTAGNPAVYTIRPLVYDLPQSASVNRARILLTAQANNTAVNYPGGGVGGTWLTDMIIKFYDAQGKYIDMITMGKGTSGRCPVNHVVDIEFNRMIVNVKRVVFHMTGYCYGLVEIELYPLRMELPIVPPAGPSGPLRYIVSADAITEPGDLPAIWPNLCTGLSPSIINPFTGATEEGNNFVNGSGWRATNTSWLRDDGNQDYAAQINPGAANVWITFATVAPIINRVRYHFYHQGSGLSGEYKMTIHTLEFYDENGNIIVSHDMPYLPVMATGSNNNQKRMIIIEASIEGGATICTNCKAIRWNHFPGEGWRGFTEVTVT